MPGSRALVELPDTKPEPLPGSSLRPEGPDLDAAITVTIVVRSQADDETTEKDFRELAQTLPHERPSRSYDDFVRRYGSAEADLAAVQAFAAGQGLTVVEASAARCAAEVSGSLAALSRAFGVRFVTLDSAVGSYRSHDGPIRIPHNLRGIIEDVIGFDDRPILRPSVASSVLGKLTHTDPRTIADFYQFPPDATGAGQCVGILEFGGGFYQSDLETYFHLRGLSVPKITLVELEGQSNRPADRKTILDCAEYYGQLPAGSGGNPRACNPNSLAYPGTAECSMDIQLLGTLVPDALLAVYMAPSTTRGLYIAFSRAIADLRLAPSVISCSWGWYENKEISQRSMLSIDRLLRRAALKGVTVCVSTGDFGNGASLFGQPVAQFPATSPYVLACGGSSVPPDLSRETTWYEVEGTVILSGGGGFSQVFPLPEWQKTAGAGSGGQTGRGSPDVAARADVQTGYDVVVGGLDLPSGGTSAAAPMWAALAARMNQILGHPVGFFTSLLYTKPFSSATRKITQSGGGPCVPLPSWDTCTGLGSPVGTSLLAALSRRQT
ncbi:MAG TPA: S53 family peptidase [Thermoanaerobaculia bacterium]|nr:S53 family peptidase [Thermoanaerobaculia bacterium]